MATTSPRCRFRSTIRELRQRILAGRFLTTIYDIDLEGKKHRVIPRDFHLDPVRDFPIHVDFMRLGEGATIRVSVPLHIQNAEVVARREARRHRQHRHPHHRPGMLGRQHSAIYRGRRRRAGNQPLAASVRHQAADRREVAVARRRDARHHRAAVRLRRRAEGGCGCRCGRCAGGWCCGCSRCGSCGRRCGCARGRCGSCRWRQSARGGAKAPAGGGDKKK